MYYTTQDNQEKRIKSLADLFLIINKLNLKDKSMQKTFQTSSTFSLNSILMLTFLFREWGIAFAFGKCSGKCSGLTVNLMRIAIVTHARDCLWMYTIYQNQMERNDFNRALTFGQYTQLNDWLVSIVTRAFILQ